MSLPNTKPLIFNTQTINNCKVGINKNTAPTATLDVNGSAKFSEQIRVPNINNGVYQSKGFLKFQGDTSRIYNRDINNASALKYEFIQVFLIPGDTTVNSTSSFATDLQTFNDTDELPTNKIVNTTEDQECLFRVGTIKTTNNTANHGTRGEIVLLED